MPSVDAVRPRSRPQDPDPPPAPRPPAAPRPPDHAIDASVADACRTFNDRILYLGFNASSRAAEVGALGPNVSVIAASSSSSVTLAGTSYDLATSVKEFAAAMGPAFGLDLAQQTHLAGILGATPASGRDEIAKIAIAWAPAQRGAAIPSRLVISGHSSFGEVWGEGDVGAIPLQAIRDLGRTLPKAAAQIEDVHIAGCYSEDQVQSSEKWTVAFPNLKTIWAYGGSSPLAPTSHLAGWEAATRGRTNQLGDAFMKAYPPATAWSVGGGIANATASLDERERRVNEASSRFDAYFSGDLRIVHPHQTDADHDYGAYQMLAAAHDAPPAERASAAERGGHMLRLRFWEASVRGEIATHYGAQINAAFAKAGLAPVDFATMTRKDAVAAIDRYRAANGSLGPILDGIVNLRRTVIPSSWCH